ncbi:MAG: DUF433 domain-containing protein [Chloroflexi bacterium]|nr:DUF433 domain-containing protein [Chloroflexota bacterium]
MTYPHVASNATGIPVITGTTMKVVESVLAQMAYGWTPEELHLQPRYLTLGQIHAALAYYWDHKEELDADIERRTREAEQARREAGPSPLVAKLRDLEVIAKATDPDDFADRVEYLPL